MNVDVRGLYHESYYEHSCVIRDKKDILNSDIRGSACFAKLRRWWWELFLVSYNDIRCRTYYTSSEAMRLERIRHFRNFKGRIHPLSTFRNLWDFFILHVLIANMIVIYHNTSFIHGQICCHFYYIGAILEQIVMFDIYINLKTGYIDPEIRKIILEKYDGLLKYGSSKLFFHVASAVPLQCIMFLRYGIKIKNDLCKTNSFVTTIKILSIFKLFRVYECSNYWTRERSNYKVTHFFKFLRIAVLGLLTMTCFYALADATVLMVMITEGKIEPDSFVGLRLHLRYAVPKPCPCSSFFIYNIIRSCKSLLLLSHYYGPVTFYIDQMTILAAYVIANTFFIWMIQEIFSFLYTSNSFDDQLLHLKNTTYGLVSCRQLPDKVTKKIWKYYDFNYAKMKALEENNIFIKYLPEILKKECSLATYSHYIKKIPYFCGWPPDVIESIVIMLKMDICLDNDMVADPWVQSEGLLIVGTGELAVYNGDIETGHLINGDYFGELSLVTDKEVRTSTVVAISSCVILMLDKILFRRLMREYPDLFYSLKEELLTKFSKNMSASSTDKVII